ncbi:hypothetical protein FACS189427_10680 [Planctomycetales bacterium]|nr:hypothetical protein FACS189427_10680 [Planctomycetales bacterium]
MPANQLIYFGDDTQQGAAAYLSGVMLYYGIKFVHIDTALPPPADFVGNRYSAFILSDYPGRNFSQEQLQFIKDSVAAGSGLLMLGGWDSYCGQNGKYNETVLTDVLPIIMQDTDDRQNFSQTAVVKVKEEHPVLAGLPWDYPPCIGGCNKITAKESTAENNVQTLLTVIPYDIRIDFEDKGSVRFSSREELPLLVIGEYGKGKTAAFATDAAPHWVGGLVDWGKERITQRVSETNEIETGADYAKFLKQLIEYVSAG